ncbi:amine sulfotransferase-like [Narcine bancroftii]|uniref:amine sulfotransferase-like n=1 Tax=Narcine bancroftii TaxID=1343680 RepID=UPI0038313B77
MFSTPNELFEYKGCNFISNIHNVEYLNKIPNLDIKKDDVIVVTYPKSGTVWMQQILSLICSNDNLAEAQSELTVNLVPWIEVERLPFKGSLLSPLYVTHLPYHLIPKNLKKGNGKVIYVARNPKDVFVSLYYFQNYLTLLESTSSFEDFLEKFIDGKVLIGSWFDHVREWYKHKDEFDFLFLTYEELQQDFRTSTQKLCDFLGKKLDEDKLEMVVEECSFKAMLANPMANYKHIPNKNPNGTFLRKGIIGDWKNHFTVAQSERFDKIFEEKMEDFPFQFVWDSKK